MLSTAPVVTTALSLLLGAEQYALSRVSRHATPQVLVLAFAPLALRAAAVAAWAHHRFESPLLVSDATQRRRSWCIVACECARTFLQVYASRVSPVWVWASADVSGLGPPSSSPRR